MRYAPPTPEEQVRFLENFQTLLNEGQFTASYKFALLVALADIAVETGDDSGGPLEIPVSRIAEKFVSYYWNQVVPWAPAARTTQPRVLAQSTGKTAAVIRRLLEVRERVSPYEVDVRRDPRAWQKLVRSVKAVTERQPLWKLQRVPGRNLGFLYEETGNTDAIVLTRGVASNLRRFYPLLTGMARAAWADFVRKLKANQPLLGQATDLHSFLFGAERTDLKEVRHILQELQDGRCFYCGRRLRREAPVDHFVPWSRYPVDLAHNFVLADFSCNANKSDFLPQVSYLERWVRRNSDRRELLDDEFARARVPHDGAASLRITSWAFEQVARAGGRVWAGGRSYEPLGRRWRDVLTFTRRPGGA